MQATISTWDPSEGGSAYLDDGTLVTIPATALVGSAFRFVRSGQRVRLTIDDSGAVVAADLP